MSYWSTQEMKSSGLKHDSQIDHLTKADLVGVLAGVEIAGGRTGFTSTELGKWKKTELVDLAVQHIEWLKAEKARTKREAEEARLAKVEEEKADPVQQKAVEVVAHCLRKKLDESLEALGKIKDEIASKEVWNMSYVLEWNTENVFFHDELARSLNGLVRAFEGQAVERTFTGDQIAGHLTDAVSDLRREVCYRDGYRHNSTSAVSNVQNMEKFKARQRAFAILEGAAKLYEKARAGDEVALNCPHIHEQTGW
jgi:hypothetical protein